MSQTSLIREIIRINRGGPKYEEIRNGALAGNPLALRKYVYYSWWRSIRLNKSIPPKKRIPLFRELVDSIDLEVQIDG